MEVLGKHAEPLPEIYYIEGTLQMVWINRCFPGYGMNLLKHPRCPECCGRHRLPLGAVTEEGSLASVGLSLQCAIILGVSVVNLK